MTKIVVSEILTVCILLGLAFILIYLGLTWHPEIIKFCTESRDNKSFMKDFTLKTDDYVLNECADFFGKPGEEYSICIYNHATYEQNKFMGSCGWMKEDWFAYLIKIGISVSGVGLIFIAFSLTRQKKEEGPIY